jgi:uncharacterized membrane protein
MTNTHSPKPAFLSGRTLFRLGLGLLVLSAVFFLRYSIEQGWLGPLARVALAGGVGLSMIGVGLTIHKRAYGLMLQGAGAAVVFLTVYAAHDHYGLTSTTEAFVQLVAAATLTLVLAHRSRSELLAGLGLVGAAAAPTLIEGRMAVPWAEIGYIVLVGVVSTSLFFREGWIRMQVATGLALLTAVAIDVFPPADRTTALALESVLVVTWAMLVAVPLIGCLIGGRLAHPSFAIVTSSVGSLGLYAGTRAIFFDSGTGILWTSFALSLAGLHLLAARELGRRPQSATVGAAQFVPVVTLALVATVEALTGDWVLVGSSVLALSLVVAGHHGAHRRLADAGHVLFLVTAVLGVGAAAIVTGDTRSLPQLVPGLVVLTTAATIGVVIRKTADHDLSTLYLIAAYFGALLWMAVEIPRLGSEGLAWVTAGWSVIGIAAIVTGRLTNRKNVLGSGFATIGLAVGKLFFVDLAEASPLTRIALFAGVGLVLVLGGYWLGDWSLEVDSEELEQS